MLKKVHEELKKVFLADVTDLESGYWYHKASYLLCMMYFDGRGTRNDVPKAQEVLRTGGTESSLEVTYEEKRRLEALREALKEAQSDTIEAILEALERLKK